MIFAYTKTNQNIGIWIVVMILFSFVLGITTSGYDYKQRVHPSFLIGKYSKYNTNVK
jgi:hypothetical protein